MRRFKIVYYWDGKIESQTFANQSDFDDAVAAVEDAGFLFVVLDNRLGDLRLQGDVVREGGLEFGDFREPGQQGGLVHGQGAGLPAGHLAEVPLQSVEPEGLHRGQEVALDGLRAVVGGLLLCRGVQEPTCRHCLGLFEGDAGRHIRHLETPLNVLAFRSYLLYNTSKPEEPYVGCLGT